jgi:hypothetical protein
MNQKIPPEILSGQELALISQAELHITFPYGGPCISVNGVHARLVHKLPHDIDVINGEFGSLVKSDRLCERALGIAGAIVILSGACGT